MTCQAGLTPPGPWGNVGTVNPPESTLATRQEMSCGGQSVKAYSPTSLFPTTHPRDILPHQSPLY